MATSADVCFSLNSRASVVSLNGNVGKGFEISAGRSNDGGSSSRCIFNIPALGN